MTKKETLALVIKAFQIFLTSIKRDVRDIGENTDPMDHLGLDSQDAVSWCCDAEEVGLVLPADFDPFVKCSKGKVEHRMVGDIADLLWKLQNADDGGAE